MLPLHREFKRTSFVAPDLDQISTPLSGGGVSRPDMQLELGASKRSIHGEIVVVM